MSKKDKVNLLEQPSNGRNFNYKEEDPNYGGQPLSENVRNGPLNNRGCNDIFFILIYFILWAVMLVIAYFAYQNGNPNLLLSPFDIYDNHCGYNLTKDFKQIYIQEINEYYCVTSCPVNAGDILNCYNCTSGTKASYASQQVLTLCYPNDDKYEQIIENMVDFKGSDKFFSDLKVTWPAIAGCSFIALIISLLLTYLIKCMTKCIVWSMIIIYLALVASIGTVSYLQATSSDFSQYKYINDNQWLLVIAYTFWSIAIISLLLVVCLFNKIILAVAILKAAADFMRDVFYIIFVPLFIFILVLGFFAFWLVVSVYIYSSGNITKSKDGPYFAVQWDTNNKYQLILYLFGLFWNCEFAVAFCQFVVSSSTCIWYFSHMGATLKNPVSKSICRGLSYHLGSLLFGSLILSIIQIFKFLLNQIHKAMKTSVLSHDGIQDNAIMRCGFACCSYLLKYFETFIRFLNSNAYIMIALTGDNFCRAAYDAFYLLLRNILNVAITHGLGQIFQFIGTLFITAATTSLCYLLITELDYFSSKLVSPIAPTIVFNIILKKAFIIISYVVGSLFMNLYGIGTDSILICYLADYELNRSQGGAKSMPGSLKEFLHDYQIFINNCSRFSSKKQQQDILLRKNLISQYDSNDTKFSVGQQVIKFNQNKILGIIAAFGIMFYLYQLYDLLDSDYILNQKYETLLAQKAISHLVDENIQSNDELLIDKVNQVMNQHNQNQYLKVEKVNIFNNEIPLLKLFPNGQLLISREMASNLSILTLQSLLIYEQAHIKLRSNAQNIHPRQLHKIVIMKTFGFSKFLFDYFTFNHSVLAKQYFFLDYDPLQINKALQYVQELEGQGSVDRLKSLFSEQKKLFAGVEDKYSMFNQNKNVYL